MTATSVASSSQMFSAFGQATRSPSPMINPFASQSEGEGGSFGFGGAGDSSGAKRNKRKTRFNDSDNESKRKASNPFMDKEVNLSDSSTKKGKHGEEKKRKAAESKKTTSNGDPSKKPRPQKPSKFANPFGSANTGSRPSSSSSSLSNEPSDSEPAAIPYSNDPHAKKVYEQLRKDGISPPQWPSEPGNPKNKAEVTKFRERYEAYRDKVRASLTKAGLIDDPDKRKTLQDAIDFKGICEEMCPEYEKITRINEMDVHQPEKDSKTSQPNTRRMIKKLARSAAGQEAPLPMDVRSVPALRRTLDYLIDDLLRNDGNLAHLHGFLWDRTRAIRRDFTFFSSLTPEEMKTQVYVLENIARFHVTALHLLSQEGKAPEDFVEQQELEQLGKSLLSLRDLYDDCNEQGITCENEAEFRAFYLIFHARDSNIIETLQRQWKPNLWRDSDEVRTAVSLVEALQNTQDFHGPLKDAPSLAAASAYNSYFRIVEDPQVSYTMACFAECHFPHLRRSILTAVKRSLARPRESTKDVTAAVLNKFLRFDTVEEAIEFAELHDFEFGTDDEEPSNLSRQYLMLDNRKLLPHPRLQHQFSRTLVEKKRGSRRLPDLIHQSIQEEPSTVKPSVNGASEESLFVSDEQPQQAKFPSSSGFSSAKPSTFSAFGQPSGAQNAHNPFKDHQGSLSNGVAPTPATTTTQQPSPFFNPFASSNQEKSKPASNPFASSTPAISPLQPLSQGSSSIPSTTPKQEESPVVPPANPFAFLQKPTATTDAPTISSPFPSSGSFKASESKVAPPATPSFPAFQTQTKPPSDNVSNQGPSTQAPQLGISLNSQAKNGQAPQSDAAPSLSQSSSPFKTIGSTVSSFPPAPSGLLGQQEKPDAAKTQARLEDSTKPFSFLSQPSNGSQASMPGSGATAFPDPKALPVPSAAESAAKPSISMFPAGSSITETSSPQVLHSKPVAPPQDLMGNFASWFVKGDNGLLEEFQSFIIDNLLQDVFSKFQEEKERKRRKEEDERALAKAQEFRTYNLSLKYFYRWREIAREKRLGELRRSGRDQVKLYWEAQRAAELQAQQEYARQAAKEQAEIAELNRPEEFKDLLNHRKVSKRQARDELLASGVLAGVINAEEVAANIVRRGRSPSLNGSTASSHSRLSQSSSRGGAKTQALRERFSQERSASFRRSLPPMSSKEDAHLRSSSRTRRVSERWRLKAMGITQMPDGTALPESLANEIRLGTKKYLGQGSMGPPTSIPSHRVSERWKTASDGQRASSGPLPSIESTTEDASALKNKRKRPTEDDGTAIEEDGPKSNTHRRVMSDAEKLMSELRAMREEMEEGASWFKTQNERLQSELSSRGSTPWDESM